MTEETLKADVDRVSAWLDALPDTAKRFTIVYHGDCDGVISAVLFDYIFSRLYNAPDIRHIPVRTEQYDFEHVLNEVDTNPPDIVVSLDLSLQNLPHRLQHISERTRHAILIYDHHEQENDIVPANTLYLNPSATPNGYAENAPPPCLFSARLAQKLTGNDFDWLACIGLIAESMVDTFLPLFQKLPETFPEMCLAAGIEKPEDVYRCQIKNITYAIGSAFWALPGEFEHIAFDVLSQLAHRYSPKYFFDEGNFDAQKLMQLEKRVRSEINRLYSEAIFNSYYAPDAHLRYTEIKSDFRVGGVVAARLGRKYKDDIIITGQRYSGRYVVEGRCGPRRPVDLARLLRDATRDLNPYSVGGHPAAAGATLPTESSPQFFISLEKTAKKLRSADTSNYS